MPSSFAGCAINFAVRTFEIGVGNKTWTTVPGAGNVDDVEVVLLDQAIQMNIDEVQSRVVPQWPRSRGLMCFSCSGSRSNGLSYNRFGQRRDSWQRANRRGLSAAPRRKGFVRILELGGTGNGRHLQFSCDLILVSLMLLERFEVLKLYGHGFLPRRWLGPSSYSSPTTIREYLLCHLGAASFEQGGAQRRSRYASRGEGEQAVLCGKRLPWTPCTSSAHSIK